MAAYQSPKLLVKVRVLVGVPICGTHMNSKHTKLDWWISVREDPKFDTPGDRRRRICDIMYGYIAIYRFPKTHARLSRQRSKQKRHPGLKHESDRLSIKLQRHGPTIISKHFTPYYKTVKGVLWSNTARCNKKIRRTHVKEYGQRHKLIITPRMDRFIKKYGYLGG